jgi:hypothetical protein
MDKSTEALDKTVSRLKRSSTVPVEGFSTAASLDPIPLPLIKQSHFHRRPKSVTLIQPRERSLSGHDAIRVQRKAIHAPSQIDETKSIVDESYYNITGENAQTFRTTELPKQVPIADASSCLPKFCSVNNGDKMDDDIIMYSPIE